MEIAVLAMLSILFVLYWLGRFLDWLINRPFHEGGNHQARVKKLNEYRDAFLKRQKILSTNKHLQNE